MVTVVGLGLLDPEFKSCFAVELIPGGVDSACHPSEVSKMSASLLVSCVGVATRPGLYPISKETAQAAPTLCRESGPDGWVEHDLFKLTLVPCPLLFTSETLILIFWNILEISSNTVNK